MDKAYDTKISPPTLRDGFPRRLLWQTLLSVPLSILPFCFGLFSWVMIFSALLLGCLTFIDGLRLVARPTARPMPFVFVSTSFIFFWMGYLGRLDSAAKFALAGQGVGLSSLLGGWLCYYFRDVIAKVSTTSNESIGVTTQRRI